MSGSVNGYQQTAEKYTPFNSNLLIIAESPLAAVDCYFHIEEVQKHNSLWIGLMKTLYRDGFGDDTARERLHKREWLTKFKNDGYRLIDTLKELMCLSVKSPH